MFCSIQLRDATQEGFIQAIEKYENNRESNKTINKVIDDIQSHMKCCGAAGPEDWHNNSQSFQPNTWPYSCCANITSSEPLCTNKDKVYPEGCVNKIDDEVRNSIGLLGAIAITIAVIQLFGIIFACSLSRTIRKEYEVV